MPTGRVAAEFCVCAALCMCTAAAGSALDGALLAVVLLAALCGRVARLMRAARRNELAAAMIATREEAVAAVANAVACESAPSELFELVCAQGARALGVSRCLLVRTAGPLHRERGREHPPGEPGGTEVVRLHSAGAADLLEQQQRASGDSARKYAAAAAEIEVEGMLWGTLCVPASCAQALRDDAQTTLSRLAGLLARGIANAEERSRLLTRASTDALTGLADHRTFHEQLGEELVRARRYARSVSVAIFDIDRFKLINDNVGHLAGDEVLKEVATRIAHALRGESLVARLGGDEIAVLLPESDATTARPAVERARATVSSEPIRSVGRVTMSVGICDNSHASSPDRLLELADGALYWAKVHGRNMCVEYSPEVVSELSAAERADRLARSQAVIGLLALARAIDAKDPATIRHSERVSQIVAELAEARGWSPARVEALREAGLVHDVGKLGIPDSILSLPGRLSEEQYELVKSHTTLGAQIVDDILDPEQVQWVRWHHERPDGLGYPDGLEGAEIPEGALLLALADAWDAMTSDRAYSRRMADSEALVECIALAGKQFAPEAVQALIQTLGAQAVRPAA